MPTGPKVINPSASLRYYVRRSSDGTYWRDATKVWTAKIADATRFTRAQVPRALEDAAKRTSNTATYMEQVPQ